METTVMGLGSWGLEGPPANPRNPPKQSVGSMPGLATRT